MARASEDGSLVVIPAVVIAETTRGGAQDATVNRVLKAIDQISTVTEQVARMAGRLQGTAGFSATVDALVVAEAVLGGPAVILTGDAEDIGRLVGDHIHVRVYGVNEV